MQTIEIKIKGHVDRDLSNSLADLQVTHVADGSSLLWGVVRDQSALYGLLFQLSNLGLQLISVSSTDLNVIDIGKGVKV